MVSRRPQNDASSVPQDFPETSPPDELFPTNNIRFVMWETAKLTERVDGLTKAIEKLGPSFERALEKHAVDVKERIADVKADVKESSGKITDLEKGVSFVKGAMWVLGGLFAIAIVILGVVARALLT